METDCRLREAVSRHLPDAATFIAYAANRLRKDLPKWATTQHLFCITLDALQERLITGVRDRDGAVRLFDLVSVFFAEGTRHPCRWPVGVAEAMEAFPERIHAGITCSILLTDGKPAMELKRAKVRRTVAKALAAACAEKTANKPADPLKEILCLSLALAVIVSKKGKSEKACLELSRHLLRSLHLCVDAAHLREEKPWMQYEGAFITAAQNRISEDFTELGH